LSIGSEERVGISFSGSEKRDAYQREEIAENNADN